MKIIIVHGDHETKSYARLKAFINEAKRRNWEIVRLDNKAKLSLVEQLSSSSLFTSTKLFILENFNQLPKKTLQWIHKNISKLEGTLIIYQKGPISKINQKMLPSVQKVEEFKLPKLIWSSLDSIYPGNTKNAIYLIHEVVKTDPIEFVFALIAKQMRDLYWIKLNPKSLPYPSWRVVKLKRQASKFENSQIEQMLKDLAKIDVEAKSSKADLLGSLDFVLATRLE